MLLDAFGVDQLLGLSNLLLSQSTRILFFLLDDVAAGFAGVADLKIVDLLSFIVDDDVQLLLFECFLLLDLLESHFFHEVYVVLLIRKTIRNDISFIASFERQSDALLFQFPCIFLDLSVVICDFLEAGVLLPQPDPLARFLSDFGHFQELCSVFK